MVLGFGRNRLRLLGIPTREDGFPLGRTRDEQHATSGWIGVQIDQTPPRPEVTTPYFLDHSLPSLASDGRLCDCVLASSLRASVVRVAASSGIIS